jgi:hypothetical protein
MIESKIIERIRTHYENSSEPLLLSQFGKSLRVEGLWPVESETRSLREVIESQRPEVDVIRDPTALAFAVVVTKGKESIAHEIIKARHDNALLINLPRSVILAFVARKPDGLNMFLQTKNPFKYLISVSPDGEDYVLVDEEFRIRTVYFEKLSELPKEQADQLSDNIRKWAARHSISLDTFYSKDVRTERPPSNRFVGQASHQPINTRSALERLRAAQPPDIRDRIVVPIDIALKLSQLP